jgi:type IV secretory pathway TrbD component
VPAASVDGLLEQIHREATPNSGVLAGLLIGGGIVIGTHLPSIFGLAGWFTAIVLLIFTFIGRNVAWRQSK